MDLEEIKLKRLSNLYLAEKTDYLSVLHDLCGLQAQFLSNAVHALKLRCNDFDSVDMDTLIKSWTLRGTMHIFARDDLPLFMHRDRSHRLRPCDTLEQDEYISRPRKEFFAQLIVESVSHGVENREELRTLCISRGMTDREEKSVFNSWGGTIRALCENGTLCHKLQEKKAFRLCPEFEPMEEADAFKELCRRYFTAYGPATLRDAAYFFGCSQSKIKNSLRLLPVSCADYDGKTYFFIENSKQHTEKIPDCIFLAGFDPLLLGYRKEENPFLPPEHLRGIFSLAGIVNPAVLLHGRIVGKWKKKDRKLNITFFEELSAGDAASIRDCAAQLWPEINKINLQTENHL